MKNRLPHIVAAGAIAGLAGCSATSEPFVEENVQSGGFSSALAQAYQSRTAKEISRDHNWRHADRIAAKGEAAADGKVVLPWNPANWNVAESTLPALRDGRRRLMATLDTNREMRPQACAEAQVSYDGWVEQANDNDLGPGFEGAVQPDRVQQERRAFEAYLKQCRGASTDTVAGRTQRHWEVYFPFDSARITPEARATINAIADSLSGDDIALMAQGHTDTAGPAPYNNRLSAERALAVARVLSEAGFAHVDTAAVGEDDLKVATPDGVRNPKNRRVEIAVQNGRTARLR